MAPFLKTQPEAWGLRSEHASKCRELKTCEWPFSRWILPDVNSIEWSSQKTFGIFWEGDVIAFQSVWLSKYGFNPWDASDSAYTSTVVNMVVEILTRWLGGTVAQTLTYATCKPDHTRDWTHTYRKKMQHTRRRATYQLKNTTHWYLWH